MYWSGLISILLLASFSCSEISQSEYDTLYDYAKFASIAYCLKYGLTVGYLSNSCPLEKCQSDELKYIEVLETFNFNQWGEVGSGYLALDHTLKRIILTFRGTASRRDWIGNFDFIQIPYKPISESPDYNPNKFIPCQNCMVHKGFYNFLVLNCQRIVQTTKNTKEIYPDYKLIVTGHSLGGALGLLAGLEFYVMGYDPLVITYASPRVGDENFASWVDTIFQSNSIDLRSIRNGYIRVVHDGDLVPKLPPAPFFKHAGIVYRITKKDLPQSKENVDVHSSDDFVSISMTLDYLPSFMGKYEHKYYFLRMTGCDDNKGDKVEAKGETQ